MITVFAMIASTMTVNAVASFWTIATALGWACSVDYFNFMATARKS
jgi:hypothetical protein